MILRIFHRIKTLCVASKKECVIKELHHKSAVKNHFLCAFQANVLPTPVFWFFWWFFFLFVCFFIF